MMNIPEHNQVPGLVLWETFKDESSVLNNNLTITGSPLIDNGASGFSSGVNYLSLPQSNAQLNFRRHSMTCKVFIPSGLSGYNGIIGWGNEWRVYYYPDTQKIYLRYRSASTTRFCASPDISSALDGVFTISYYVYESGGNSYAGLFVNNTVDERSDAGSLEDPNGDITIGDTAGIQHFQGTIDDVKIFNRILTQEDHLKLWGESHSIVNRTFEENFVDSDSVEGNGFTITGSPTINNGASGFVHGTDYLTAPDRFYYKEVSFSVKAHIPSTLSGYQAMLGWGGDWRLYFYASNNYVYFRYKVSGTARVAGIDITSLLDSTVTITCTLRESGGNTISTLYVNTLSGGRSDAGTIDDPSGDLLIGDSLGIDAFGDTIYEFKYFDHVLTQEDHLNVIWEDDFVSGLALHEKFEDKSGVERNGFTVVGSPTINHGISNLSTSDYCLFNYTFPSSFSIFVRLIVADNGVTWERIFESQNTYFRIAWDPTNDRYYARTKIGASYISIHLNLDMTSYVGQEVTLGFTFVYDGANTTCHAYLNGVLKNSSGANPGAVETTDNPIWFGVNSGASSSAFRDEIKELRFYNIVLSEDDFYMLHHNPKFMYELLPENSLFTVKGDSSYNDGANQVTDCLGSVISKATMGDGSTPATFPDIENKLFISDGSNTYMNCGDNDAFTLTTNTPFTVGCIFRQDDTATRYLLGKHDSLTVGEWAFFSGSSELRFVFTDIVTGDYYQWEANANSIDTGRLFFGVFTYDGSNTFSTDSGKFYLDGKNVTDRVLTTGGFNQVYNTTKVLNIGAQSDLGGILLGKIGVPFVILEEFSQLQVEILYRDLKQYLSS